MLPLGTHTRRRVGAFCFRPRDRDDPEARAGAEESASDARSVLTLRKGRLALRGFERTEDACSAGAFGLLLFCFEVC